MIKTKDFSSEIWYNVKYFMARLEYAKERVIKLLYLIFDEKFYKGKVFSRFSFDMTKIEKIEIKINYFK